MADPLLQDKFPEKALNQAVAVAAMCLQEEASVRPLMSDVVTTLSFLLAIPEDPAPAPTKKSDAAHSDHGDSSDEGSESTGSDEEGSERRGSRISSKSGVSSSRHKKGSSRSLSDEGSISSSSSSSGDGSICSGHSNSKRSHGGRSISSLSR